jgi:hypothetical protein
VSHYPSRQAMQMVIHERKLKERHQSLPWHLKFRYFFTMNKRRFFYMFLMFLAYRYGERVKNYFINKRIKTINKYKRRWLSRYNPEAATF